MLTVEIVNDCTGTDESANYGYRVLVNDQIIHRGSVSGHNRNDPWINLIRLLIDQVDDQVTYQS
jgi:hypothetical protein